MLAYPLRAVPCLGSAPKIGTTVGSQPLWSFISRSAPLMLRGVIRAHPTAAAKGWACRLGIPSRFLAPLSPPPHRYHQGRSPTRSRPADPPHAMHAADLPQPRSISPSRGAISGRPIVYYRLHCIERISSSFQGLHSLYSLVFLQSLFSLSPL